MIDNYKASELTDKLSAAFGKYNESTQTYYVNEALAKQHVRQISRGRLETGRKQLKSYGTGIMQSFKCIRNC